ncbi:MAG: hypothetical protein ACR2P0_08345 [Acidimicrobiales bacterium]
MVRLKWRLVRTRRSHSTLVLVAVIAVTAMGSLLAFGASIALSLRDDASTAAMLGLTAVGLAWLLVTIVLNGGEATLDPTRFALLPIPVRHLVVGLLAASFLGAPAVVTAVAVLSFTLQATSISSALVLVLGAVLVWCGAVMSGRVALMAMTGLLRGRRTQEIAGGLALLVGITVGSAAPILSDRSEVFSEERLVSARSILRLLPWGWGPEAMARSMNGDVAGALPFLFAAAGFAFVLVRSWAALVERLLSTRTAAVASDVERSLTPRWMMAFGRSPVVAVWARSWRQLRRDPREFLEVAGFVPMMVIFALPGLDAIRDGDDRAVLSSASIGIALGLTSLNMFGADGRSFGVDALAASSMRSVLVGKALARLTVGIPVILALASVLAAFTDGWHFVIPSLAIGLTGLLAMTAVGMFVSTRFPFPLPKDMSLTAGQGLEGCVTGLIRMGALVGAMAVAAPGVGATTLVAVKVGAPAATSVGLASIAYGLGLFWVSSRRSGDWTMQHVPEVMTRLSAFG